jgi:hypothetical protein
MKTHYRKVFKSDHLGIADLEDFQEEGKRLVFTIKEVRQEYQAQVAGKKIDANIAYFNESIKPLVLNSTNSKVIKSFTGSSFVEDWQNVLVELYIDQNVKMKGQTVGGVRISPKQPTLKKPELNPESKSWESAKVHVKANKPSFEALNKNYSITKENYDLLCL